MIACSYLFRSLGSSIGVSSSSAVLQQVLRTQLAARLGDDVAGGVEEKVRRSLDAIADLDPDVQVVVRGCYRVATTALFVPTAAFLVCALVASCFIRERRLGR